MLAIIAHRHAATVAVLVLAAGASRRLGRPKALVRVRGRTLLGRAVTEALRLRPLWVGVVVGARAGRLAAELAPWPVEVVRARHWRAGLSASLRTGLHAVPREARHVLILAVDQWAVTAEDLARLVRRRGGTAVAAEYAGIAGIPALFPRRAWPALAALSGDRGARALLAAPGTRRVALARAVLDLDTPADLRQLRNRSVWVRQVTHHINSITN